MIVKNIQTGKSTIMENTYGNVSHMLDSVNKYAVNKFTFKPNSDDKLLSIEHRLDNVNICINNITEIWIGDGYVRVAMKNGTTCVTLYEFGKIQTFLF